MEDLIDAIIISVITARPMMTNNAVTLAIASLFIYCEKVVFKKSATTKDCAEDPTKEEVWMDMHWHL
jgi:hypothetical protein